MDKIKKYQSSISKADTTYEKFKVIMGKNIDLEYSLVKKFHLTETEVVSIFIVAFVLIHGILHGFRTLFKLTVFKDSRH